MRWLGLLLLLLAGAVGLLWAADGKNPNEEPIKGFLIHEWGVWRVHDDIEMANADMRAQWDELPAFVYGQTTTRDFPRHWDQPIMTVTKPVLFFHAPAAMQADLRVGFPTGVPAVWWPATENPAYQGLGYTIDGQPRKTEKVATFLEWKLGLKRPHWPVVQAPSVKELSTPHWMQTLRDVKCDDVYVSVGERGRTMEREKFVYYDGLLPRIKALSIKVDKEKVALKNQEKFAVFDLWIIDNRDAAKPRVGRLSRLDGGGAKAVELDVQKEARWLEDAGKTLTAQLKDAGLNEDEAASLTTIWNADFFQSAGVTLFYRVPQEEYDRLLPLTVKPRPEKIVRVGLVQQIPFEQELADRVARLVQQLDDDEFTRREAAQQELAKLGPVALGYLQRLKAKLTTPEPKRRVDELLEKYEAQRSLKK
jgi:hypothetical protein